VRENNSSVIPVRQELLLAGQVGWKRNYVDISQEFTKILSVVQSIKRPVEPGVIWDEFESSFKLYNHFFFALKLPPVTVA
jgi:hypothetical protein